MANSSSTASGGGGIDELDIIVAESVTIAVKRRNHHKRHRRAKRGGEQQESAKDDSRVAATTRNKAPAARPRFLSCRSSLSPEDAKSPSICSNSSGDGVDVIRPAAPSLSTAAPRRLFLDVHDPNDDDGKSLSILIKRNHSHNIYEKDMKRINIELNHF
jgi:hypothetical protein